jgi:hypothetical protein
LSNVKHFTKFVFPKNSIKHNFTGANSQPQTLQACVPDNACGSNGQVSGEKLHPFLVFLGTGRFCFKTLAIFWIWTGVIG